MEQIASCVVGGCQYNASSNNQVPEPDDTIKYYNFPSKPGERFQRSRWIEFVRISKGLDPKSTSSWTPSPQDKICSTHFIRNFKSENPSKSNFSPTIFSQRVLYVPPQVSYDLRDFVCWWIKEGERLFPNLFPIVEAEQPSKKQPTSSSSKCKTQQSNCGQKIDDAGRTIKKFSLVEVETESEPLAYVKTCIKVFPDLTFQAYLKDIPIPARSLLSENENICLFGSVYEFQCALERLLNLNQCIGISTVGLTVFPPNMQGKVVKMTQNGKETERLVSFKCESIANIKVCSECRKFWNIVFRYSSTRKGKNVEKYAEVLTLKDREKEGEGTSVKEKLEKCERVIENYKVEVCKLVENNKILRGKVIALTKALKEEVVRKRKILHDEGQSDVEVVEELNSGNSSNEGIANGFNKKPRKDLVVLNDNRQGVESIISFPNAPMATNPPLLLESSSRKAVSDNAPPPSINDVPTANPIHNTQPVETPRKPSATVPPPKRIATSSMPITSKGPQQKVLKITKEQALLLRQFTATNTSGNVLRVQASQLATINKILGRPSTPVISAISQSPRSTNITTITSSASSSSVVSIGTSVVQTSPGVPARKPATNTQKIIRVVDSRSQVMDNSPANISEDDGKSQSGQSGTAKKVINVKIITK